MTPETSAIHTLDDLRRFVHKTLCSWANILEDQFGLNETPLTRGGRDCGLQFWIEGPRSMRLEAIWESERNSVYFFDAKGVRFLKSHLSERISRAA
ncbi:MAG TPA: hypothetical protein VGM05_11340 [Planctomycetaceae bacterium]